MKVLSTLHIKIVFYFLLSGLLFPPLIHAEIFPDNATPGQLLVLETLPGNTVEFKKSTIQVSQNGVFIIGFGRDDSGDYPLIISNPISQAIHHIHVKPRTYKTEKVDGVPKRTVSPPKSVLERIRKETRQIKQARKRSDDRIDFNSGFSWPAKGRISGVYGSQRVLNGIPKRPHFGLDIAAPQGTSVKAPAAGIITLAEADLFYSGGTIILDHGLGLTSSFLHLSKILVKPGTYVKQGDIIAEIGMTGRASGPHLDWRMNLNKDRLDPYLLLPESDNKSKP